jgi:hypothetical protein
MSELSPLSEAQRTSVADPRMSRILGNGKAYGFACIASVASLIASGGEA